MHNHADQLLALGWFEEGWFGHIVVEGQHGLKHQKWIEGTKIGSVTFFGGFGGTLLNLRRFLEGLS